MKLVNIYEAKTQLSRLLEQVNEGEEVIIAKAGHPIARLISYHANKPTRKPGARKGMVEVSEDFEQLPDEIMAAFNGEKH